jgi:hypothetical protein
VRDLFFHARTPAPGEPHAVDWPADEIPVEFIATDANGFGVQAGDFGNPFNATMPTPLRFASGDPTSLLFIQAAENQIEIPMVLSFWMIASPTCRTSAFVNRTFLRHHRPPSLVGPVA